MKTQEKIWTPHPGPQTQALKRNEFEILYGGARGGGKTDAGMAWLLRYINNPRYRALIIRKNYDDLSDWIDRARQMYRATGATFTGKPVEIRFPTGAIFRAGHLKDPTSYEKYLGQEYQRMVIEELTLIPSEELYQKLLFSCRSTIDIPPQIFATTNPGGPGHAWVKERFIDISPWGTPYTYTETITNPATGEEMDISRSRVFIQAMIEDNPTLIESDPGYVVMLENLRKTNMGLYKAWRHGDWDVPLGQVFAEFRRDTHVVTPFKIPKTWAIYGAIDLGWNRPFSAGWYAVDGEGRTYLFKEYYGNSEWFEGRFGKPMTARRLARILIATSRKMGYEPNYWVGDPAMWNKILLGRDKDRTEGESYAEIMIKAGLKLIRGDNNRMNGLTRYREALSLAADGKPFYQIFENCRDSIRTIPSLVYDQTKVEDVDTDGEDHCYDRDRYFFMSRPIAPDLEPKKERTLVQKDYARRKQRYIKEREWGEVYDEEEEWSDI